MSNHRADCPFCGANGRKLQLVQLPQVKPYVGCLGCGATGPAGILPAQAEELWNRRATIERSIIIQ